MHDDVLQEYELKVPRIKIGELENLIKSEWNEVDKIYSYMVMGFDNFIRIRYIVSADVNDNVIFTDDAISVILKHCAKELQNGVICFEQPSLEIYLVSHNPMIETMAIRIKQQWNQFEHDDLCQICRMCCVQLYEKGYYLHKKLIWVTFKNEILSSIRGLKKRGTVVSIYDKSYEAEDDKELTLLDGLVDLDALYDEQDKQDKEANLLIFSEVKDIIIDLIGQRQFDTLFRDYKNQHTTTTSRKLMVKIKNHFATLGLSRRDFNKKYH